MAWQLLAAGVLLAVAGVVEALGQPEPQAAAQLRLKKLLDEDGGDGKADLRPAVEIRVRDDPADSVIELNRLTLEGNVLQEAHPSAEHWFVLFCVDWLEECKEKARQFELASAEVQAAKNVGAYLRTPVRFGMVSCAKDKALCNDFEVESYPTVAHFWRGQRKRSMLKLKTDTKAWVQKQLAWAEAEATRLPPAAGGGVFHAVREAIRGTGASSTAGWVTIRRVMNLVAVCAIAAASLLPVLRELLPARAKPQAAKSVAAPDDEKPAAAMPPAEAAQESCLPASWARDRATLDL